jgi:hypothetical protein
VVTRLHVYKVAVTPGTRVYMDAMVSLPASQHRSTQDLGHRKYEIARNRTRRLIGLAQAGGSRHAGMNAEKRLPSRLESTIYKNLNSIVREELKWVNKRTRVA